MEGGAATRRGLYSLGWLAGGWSNRDRVASALVFAGTLAFLLLPGLLGVLPAFVCFIAATSLVPFAGLLSVLGALPLHFIFRRAAGPVELSLSDTVLLSAFLGIVARAYWTLLVSPVRTASDWLREWLRSPYIWPLLVLAAMSTLSLLVLTPRTAAGLKIGLRQYSLVIEPLAVYALARMTLGERRRLWVALDVLLAGALLVGVFGLVEAVWYAVVPHPEVGGYHRVVSVFNHPNTLGLYLSRVIPLLGGIGIALEGGLRRRVY
ncbi:MAG: hypothetical protein M3281_04295, partial [Chloroflexota bacterium]|nr:hypothetical protein [Chloroflexota bacterium]